MLNEKEIYGILNFKKICLAFEEEIGKLKLPFICGEIENNSMKIKTEDGAIGKNYCCYELFSKYENDIQNILVQVRFYDDEGSKFYARVFNCQLNFMEIGREFLGNNPEAGDFNVFLRPTDETKLEPLEEENKDKNVVKLIVQLIKLDSIVSEKLKEVFAQKHS